MMYPHPLRLRGPWEVQTLPDGPTRRVTMPSGGSDIEATGRVRFTRRFGYPGRIDDFERVWLVGLGLSESGSILLNGQPLGDVGPGDFEFDVTSKLGARNVVALELTRDSATARPWDEVGLEVRCTAYLHGVKRRETEIIGEVRGEWTGPLELYLLCDGAQAGYQVVEPGRGPKVFRFEAASGGMYQLDLVSVSSVWYRVELRG